MRRHWRCASHLSAIVTLTCSLSAVQALSSACPVSLASAISPTLLRRCIVFTTQAYQALVAKHSQLAQEHRKLLQQWGDPAVSDQVEEILAVRQQLADLVPRYDAACDTVAELRWGLDWTCLRPGLTAAIPILLSAPSRTVLLTEQHHVLAV